MRGYQPAAQGRCQSHDHRQVRSSDRARGIADGGDGEIVVDFAGTSPYSDYGINCPSATPTPTSFGVKCVGPQAPEQCSCSRPSRSWRPGAPSSMPHYCRRGSFDGPGICCRTWSLAVSIRSCPGGSGGRNLVPLEPEARSRAGHDLSDHAHGSAAHGLHGDEFHSGGRVPALPSTGSRRRRFRAA